MLVASYKTKKDLKASVGKKLAYLETSMFKSEYKADGYFAVVGPGAYERKWFAEIWMEGGKIKKVK